MKKRILFIAISVLVCTFLASAGLATTYTGWTAYAKHGCGIPLGSSGDSRPDTYAPSVNATCSNLASATWAGSTSLRAKLQANSSPGAASARAASHFVTDVLVDPGTTAFEIDVNGHVDSASSETTALLGSGSVAVTYAVWDSNDHLVTSETSYILGNGGPSSLSNEDFTLSGYVQLPNESTPTDGEFKVEVTISAVSFIGPGVMGWTSAGLGTTTTLFQGSLTSVVVNSY